MAESKLQRLKSRAQALWQARSSLDAQFQELAENFAPHRARFFQTEAGQYQKKNLRIINNAPLVAKRTFVSMLASTSHSPASKWYEYSFAHEAGDPNLEEDTEAKDWVSHVGDVTRAGLARSNAYQALATVDNDVSTFATAAQLVEGDAEGKITCYVFPAGSFAIGQNAKGEVDELVRKTSFTVRALVDEFGTDKVSPNLRTIYEAGRDMTQLVEVTQIIYPNPDVKQGAVGPEGMEFASCWWESSGLGETFLREAGYEEQPFQAPRWDATDSDAWGSTCPAMESLGDAKTLQLLEENSLLAFEKVVDPPMTGNPSLEGRRASLVPGSFTPTATGGRYEPAMTIDHGALAEYRSEKAEVTKRINSAWYADLSLMLQGVDAGKMTATEVSARQQEQMLLLGPASMRFQSELYSPLLLRVFKILWRAGKIRPPPEQLHGAELKIEYSSILSAAQKVRGTTAIERMLAIGAQIAQLDPTAADKIDLDQAQDEYAEAIGAPAKMLREDSAVAEIRAQRAQAQQQAQQQQQAMAATQGAKNLGQASLEGDNALKTLLAGMGQGNLPA